MRKTVSSAGRFLGMNTITLADGEPYLTRIWFWRLRLHIFHRGDADQDLHDHPWDFWTFPLTPYVEEVAIKKVRRIWVADQPVLASYDADGEPVYVEYNTISGGHEREEVSYEKEDRVVRAFRWHHRPAEYTHRVLGALDTRYSIYRQGLAGELTLMMPKVHHGKKIITLVWFSKPRRDWSFLKNRDGKWCWVPWKDYVLGGGKDGPCQ